MLWRWIKIVDCSLENVYLQHARRFCRRLLPEALRDLMNVRIVAWYHVFRVCAIPGTDVQGLAGAWMLRKLQRKSLTYRLHRIKWGGNSTYLVPIRKLLVMTEKGRSGAFGETITSASLHDPENPESA